jgi:molybdopterin-binding protein
MTIRAINVRNQFRGFVKEIVPGPVLSVVTSRSLTELDLRVGSEVLALVKSTEVALAKL